MPTQLVWAFLFYIFVKINKSAVIMKDDNETSIYVGIPDNCINDIAKRQERCDWCWAACIQMILKYKELIITQECIVSQKFELHRPGNNLLDDCQITELLNDLVMKNEKDGIL